MRITADPDVMERWNVYLNDVLQYNVVEACEEYGYVDCLTQLKDERGFRRRRAYGTVRIEPVTTL